MKGRYITYSAEELAWIEERQDWPRRQLAEIFRILFQRDDVSAENLKQLCLRNGWKTGRTGCFVKGSVPPNKGKKMPFNANSARTQFKKGSMNGRARERYKPIGTERLCRDGYLERKVHDGMPLQSRWRAVHIIRWEELHGPIPEGMCLKCLDGDKRNTEPGNWELIPRALLPRLAGRWQPVAYDTAPAELKPLILATAKLAHGAKQARSGKSKNHGELS